MGSPTRGNAVFAAFAAAVEDTGLRVDQDPLIPTTVDFRPSYHMPVGFQFLHHRIGNAVLREDQAAVRRFGSAGRGGTADMFHPGRITGRLDTKGPNHHWFGYYDKCPRDSTGRYLLAMECSFADRQPKADDAISVGMVDLQDNNKYIALYQTCAWSWQQGTMLQWLGFRAGQGNHLQFDGRATGT